VRQIGGEPKGDMLIMLGLNPRMAQVYRQGAEALSKKAVKFNDDAARARCGPTMRTRSRPTFGRRCSTRRATSPPGG
jgi:hypothetical protein